MDARLKRTKRLHEERANRARLALFKIGEEITLDTFEVRSLDLLVDIHHALAQAGMDLDLERVARWAKQVYLYEKGLESGPLPDLPSDFGVTQSGAASE